MPGLIWEKRRRQCGWKTLSEEKCLGEVCVFCEHHGEGFNTRGARSNSVYKVPCYQLLSWQQLRQEGWKASRELGRSIQLPCSKGQMSAAWSKYEAGNEKRSDESGHILKAKPIVFVAGLIEGMEIHIERSQGWLWGFGPWKTRSSELQVTEMGTDSWGRPRR